ncbi:MULTISPECIES: MoxR family ATPase [unclassified Methylophilus]|uniref:AAA family ATPase n=1 Tax=unclassified Methylophilus TaxID=2630143 RepID=UPI0006F2CAB0|nr:MULTISPECIES: MoxR family ATPase [unclassified Methylophilus]KQT41808.1 AAA family ATPase [Methylophilus sp. Leaf416]KQT55974.1 AAA family ATPase [Methylophilus sp. Leaf459]
MQNKIELPAWRERALAFEQALNAVVVGMPAQIRALTIAIFSRGHVLLEGDVGVGKTTLLRAAAHLLGGGYQRIEGAIDLMPSDFLYNAFINEQGQAAVKPGPLLQHEEALAVFFFNEINRARPQAHALFLRLMAERSVNAFNREYHFPHLTVFADRNRLEREETFEIPAAARDRFLMEISVQAPDEPELQRALMFDTRYYDVDALISRSPSGLTPYDQLNIVAEAVQASVRAEIPLQNYVVELWRVLKDPMAAGIQLPDVDMSRLLAGGASPRGMAMLMRSARTRAWLEGRDYLTPDDIRAVWTVVVKHRVFFNGAYALQHERLAPLLLQAVLDKVSAP